MSRRIPFVGDVRALGRQAPLRAIYEVSKRSGLHGATLRALAMRAKPKSLVAPAAFSHRPDVPDEVAERCLADAKLILAEGHRVFGRRLRVMKISDWHQVGDIDGQAHWPADRHWWAIDIRSDARLGDVKYAWELGRHRDLVVLARAAALEPGGEWHDCLVERLRSWLAATPAERGVHWYSNLEIALRVVAWMQVIGLRGATLPADIVRAMSLQIDQANRHLLVDFPYTASSMRNNHLLGDSLGLVAIGAFTGNPRGIVPRLGERAFHSQLKRHMNHDGSMIEDSASYHRFVLEMLAVKRLLGDRRPHLTQSLRAAGEHLERLGIFDGEIPQWGDWDDGRVLTSSGDPADLAGSAALALTLAGDAPRPDWRSRYDEVAWYAPPSSQGVQRPRSSGSPSLSGGLAYVAVGDWSVWFKCGTAPSHQHADLTHVSVRHKRQWLLVDPGTGTYNGPAEVRNAFRTSRAHNGLQVGDAEMFVPHRAFRWLSSAEARLGQPVIISDGVVLWGLHDAYERLPRGGRVVRTVLVTAHGVSCADWRETGTTDKARLTLALLPTTTVMESELLAPNADGIGDTRYALSGLTGSRVSVGEMEPFMGWQSNTYGEWVPAPWIVSDFDQPGPLAWGISLTGHDATSAAVEGSGIVCAGVRMEVLFTAAGATLEVTTLLDGSRRTATLGGP